MDYLSRNLSSCSMTTTIIWGSARGKVAPGCLDVTLVTPADRVSAWTINTLEQHAIQKRVLDFGIVVHVNRNIIEFDGSGVVLECTYTERHRP